MGVIERILQAKNSPAGRRLKGLPIVRSVVPKGIDTVQRRLFFGGLATLEARLRDTRQPITTRKHLPTVADGRDEGAEFSEVLSEYHTSKLHDLAYQNVYGPLFIPRRNKYLRLLELGIGTTDRYLPSSMPPEHVPGTSLRAWRALFPQAEIYGADIDERILVNEDGIQSFWVDQRSLESLAAMSTRLGPVDIVIDDGLHTPEAAINSMQVLLPTVHRGGAYVVEDIPLHFDTYWSTAVETLRPWFNTAYYSNAELNPFREPREDAGVFVAVRPFANEGP